MSVLRHWCAAAYSAIYSVEEPYLAGLCKLVLPVIELSVSHGGMGVLSTSGTQTWTWSLLRHADPMLRPMKERGRGGDRQRELLEFPTLISVSHMVSRFSQ